MPVRIRRDIAFTRLYSVDPTGAVFVSPWVPVTRADVKQEQYQSATRTRYFRPIYRVNARLKPRRRAK